MDANGKKLLNELMELSFVAVELNLFLDTHPDSKDALEDYNRISERYMLLKDKYEKTYGPLVNFGYSSSQYPWQWSQSPWPWEIEY